MINNNNNKKKEPQKAVIKTELDILKEYLSDKNLQPEQLCELIEYGSPTYIKQILDGSIVMSTEFKNRFFKYIKHQEVLRGST